MSAPTDACELKAVHRRIHQFAVDHPTARTFNLDAVDCAELVLEMAAVTQLAARNEEDPDERRKMNVVANQMRTAVSRGDAATYLEKAVPAGELTFAGLALLLPEKA